jgi:hypothetical protein
MGLRADMSVLVVIDTVLIALLSLLLLAVLRSHAELIRHLNAEGRGGHGPAEGDRVESALPRLRPDATPAFDIAGSTLDGGSLKVSPTAGQSTLLAFLSSGCLTCQAFWQDLSGAVREVLPLDARIVVVTKDRNHESPSRLRTLWTADVPLVMSSRAWDDYGVETSPYFIFVDGHAGRVVSEGSATSWGQVLSLLRDSFEDLALTGVDAGAPDERRQES